MRQRQRRDSARAWIDSGAQVTVKSYAKRYGIDTYIAFDDLTALGFPLPDSAQHWAHRPSSTPRSKTKREPEPHDDPWIIVDGRRFFVAGHTLNGVPFGIFEDEVQSCDIQPYDDPF